MQNILFRSCVESDLTAVQTMCDRLYETDPNTSQSRPEIASTFMELSRRPDKGRLIVFQKQEKIVGYGIIIFFWSNEYNGDVIEIDELYVADSERGSGVATGLFNWLDETFGTTAAGFSLQVAHKNEAAARLYRRLGFSPSRDQHMIRLLT